MWGEESFMRKGLQAIISPNYCIMNLLYAHYAGFLAFWKNPFEIYVHLPTLSSSSLFKLESRKSLPAINPFFQKQWRKKEAEPNKKKV